MKNAASLREAAFFVAALPLAWRSAQFPVMIKRLTVARRPGMPARACRSRALPVPVHCAFISKSVRSPALQL